MDKLDRVFDRQDVTKLGLVEVVHHGRQRGRFARTCGAGDQHHAARLQGQIGKNLGCVQLLQRQDLAGNGAEHSASAALLVVGVDPKACQPFNFERKVDFQELFIVLALRIVHDVVHHGMHLLVVQRLDVDAPHIAVYTNHRWQPGREMQVRRFVLDAEGQ